jgi:hypothetical protein
LLVEDASDIPARIDRFSGGLSNDAAERLPPAIDETTSLLKGVVPSARKLYLARSSLAQTVFNMINLILGVGILSLPLAFKHAGLLLGLLLFTGSAVVRRRYFHFVQIPCLSAIFLFVLLLAQLR